MSQVRQRWLAADACSISILISVVFVDELFSLFSFLSQLATHYSPTDHLHLCISSPSLQIAASIKHQEHKMSDDDMMMSEEEDYGFDYEDASDPEDEDDVLVRLENQYYTAKGRAAEDDEAALDDALGLFREVVDMEEEKGDWYISIHTTARALGAKCLVGSCTHDAAS